MHKLAQFCPRLYQVASMALLRRFFLLGALFVVACSNSQQQQQEEIEFVNEDEEMNEDNTDENLAQSDDVNEEGEANFPAENATAYNQGAVDDEMQDLEASLLNEEPSVPAVANAAPINGAPVIAANPLGNEVAANNATVVTETIPPVEEVTMQPADTASVNDASATAPADTIPEIYPANAEISWVGYEFDEKSSQVKVQIIAKGKPQFTVFQETNRLKQPELVVRFYETAIRRRLARDIDASEFRSPVAYVRMREIANAQDVDVVLTLRDAVQPRLVAKDGSVMLTFAIPERYLGPQPLPGQPVAIAENLASANILPAATDGDQPVAKRAGIYNPNPAARIFKDAPANGGDLLPVLSEPDPSLPQSDVAPDAPELLPEQEEVRVTVPRDIRIVGQFGILQVAQDNGSSPTETVGQDSPDVAAQFNGKKISLDFESTPLNFVLKALSDGSDMNFLIDPAAANTPVSIKLNDVPWDQALKAILDTYGLGMAQVGDNVIRVSRLEQMNEYMGMSRNARRIKSQSTPTSILILRLNYAQTDQMLPHVQRLLAAEGDDRMSVSADVRTRSLIVEATPTVLARVKTLVERLDYRTPQVEVAARIVEVSKNAANFLGVAWGTGFAMDPGRGMGFGSLPYPNSFNSIYSIDPGVQASTRAGSAGFQIGSINNIFDVDMLLRIEAQKGTAEIVQSTKNVVLDGQSASVQGGNVDTVIVAAAPIQLGGQAATAAAGAQTVSIQNTVTTTVTPTVLADGNVQMRLDVQSRSPSAGASTAGAAASQQTRTVNTTMMVKSGTTLVIGGVHSAGKTESTIGIPFLMDLPILGVLFRSKTKSESQVEMLTMITPTILTPAATSSGSDTGGTSSSMPLNAAPVNEVQPEFNQGNNTGNSLQPANNSNQANALQNNVEAL